MSDFAEFWDGLGYDSYALLLLLVLFLVYVIYLIYKSVVILSKDKVTPFDGGRGVSVIITSNNKADYLRENLEYFLKQNYSDFEVIVVDECSEDDTQDVLADFQKQYPNLRTTRIFPDTKFHCTKKIAINIGVLAATYDILLFSEINCRPASMDWIKTMQSYFDQNTAVAVGFTNYMQKGEIINIKRLFRFLRFLKMLLLVKSGSNVLGDGCNMAYRKRYYIENRGYTRNSQIYMGYDSEMVQALSRKGKVKVVKDDSAYMIINTARKKTWMEDFSYYYSNKREWPVLSVMKADVEVVIKYIIYLLSFYLIFVGILYKYVAALALLTFLIDFITINIYANHLKQKKLFLTSFIVTSMGLAYRLRYNVYSILTGKKWR